MPYAENMSVPWPTTLYKRRGGAKRLLGLTVYHDFVWKALFSDERTQFKNGQSLARLARSDCPEGKRPALLLTLNDDADEVPIETEDEYVVVVRIRQYLKQANVDDPAAAYYAHRLRQGITGLARFREIASSPELLEHFLGCLEGPSAFLPPASSAYLPRA